MKSYSAKEREGRHRSISDANGQKHNKVETTFQLIDNRPEAVAQRQLQEGANNSPQAKQTAQFQVMADHHSAAQQKSITPKENQTGLPPHLKTGIEHLSGYNMDDVKVHYNSDRPNSLNAHAYAQGTDIHLGAGQEKHLPHEAWHVVQQKQGRVKPTVQTKGKININDDIGLEKEADEKGKQAARFNIADVSNPSMSETPILRKKVRNGAPLQFVHKLASKDAVYIRELYDEANDWAINFPDFDGRDRAALRLYLQLLELVKALDFALQKGEVAEKNDIRNFGIQVTEMEMRLSELQNRPEEADDVQQEQEQEEEEQVEKAIDPPKQVVPKVPVKMGWGGGGLAKVMAPKSAEQIQAEEAKRLLGQKMAKQAAFDSEVEGLIQKIDKFVETQEGTPDGSGVKSGQKARVNYYPKFKASRAVMQEAAKRWKKRTKSTHKSVKNHCMSGHMQEKAAYMNFLRQVSAYDDRRANVHVYVKK